MESRADCWPIAASRRAVGGQDLDLPSGLGGSVGWRGRCIGTLAGAARRANRRGRYGAGRGVIPGRVDIAQRPAAVESKRRVGDWELDTIIGARHRGALVSMVDRCSKFTFLQRVSGKTSLAVGGAVLACLRPVSALAHTLTADNGKEFAGHREVAAGPVGGVLLCPALPLLGAWPERAYQRSGAAVFAQGDGLHRPARCPGPAGAGPPQRPSAPCSGLPHAGGSV